MISWESIAQRLLNSRPHACVADCMEPPVEVRSDTAAFKAISVVAEKGYALVRDGQNAVTGIVTGADVAHEFPRLAERYLVLNEIENHLRRLVAGRFTPADLQRVVDPNGDRAATSAEDLTLGELKRLIEDPGGWQKLSLPKIDRAVLIERLEQVRIIRNQVMHFDPDPLEEKDLQTLRDFASFVARLPDCQAPPGNCGGEAGAP